MKKLQTIKNWPRRRPRPETILSLLLCEECEKGKKKKKKITADELPQTAVRSSCACANAAEPRVRDPAVPPGTLPTIDPAVATSGKGTTPVQAVGTIVHRSMGVADHRW